MLQSTGNLKGIKFKEKEFRKELDGTLRKIMLTGMAHWLRAVTSAVPGIGFPVQTGMAKASLQALAEYLNANRAIGDGHGVAFSINRQAPSTEYKSQKLGIALSKKNNFLLEYKNQYGTFYWKFDWWTNVAHYIQNDQYPADPGLHLKYPTPWNTIPAGNIALEEYVYKTLPRLPKIQDYIFWTE